MRREENAGGLIESRTCSRAPHVRAARSATRKTLQPIEQARLLLPNLQLCLGNCFGFAVANCTEFKRELVQWLKINRVGIKCYPN